MKTSIDRKTALKNLQEIPGIGPSQAQDLWRLGYRSPSELRGEDPEKMYRRLEALKRTRIDPCQLYAFRCAVYYASTARPKPALLKWWAWKDRRP